MAEATGDSSYLDYASSMLSSAQETWATNNNIIRELCEPQCARDSKVGGRYEEATAALIVRSYRTSKQFLSGRLRTFIASPRMTMTNQPSRLC